MMKFVQIFIVICLLVPIAYATLAEVKLDQFYSRTLPRTPDPESGRIYEIGVNHIIRYATAQEVARHKRVDSIFWVGVACGVVAIAIIIANDYFGL